MSDFPEPTELPVLTGPGTRVRAGNAMGRTRTALLEAALTAVEKHTARKATMGDVARIANVAKGTLYNHFRSKDELFEAAARAAVADLGQRAAVVAATDGLGAGLAFAAEAIATSSVLARLRADEPAVLGTLLTASAGEETSLAVQTVLTAGGLAGDAVAVEMVKRWLVGHLAGPVDLPTVRSGADRLAQSIIASRAVLRVTVDKADSEVVSLVHA